MRDLLNAIVTSCHARLGSRGLPLLLALVLVSSTACMSDYVEHPHLAGTPRQEKVIPGDGAKRNFLETVSRDLPRLQTAMGDPTGYRDISFSSTGLNVEIFPTASRDRIAAWSMDDDGTVRHDEHDHTPEKLDCSDRQPFSIDAATIARLPQLVADAPRHAGSLDNPTISIVHVRRGFGVIFCGDVEIDVNLDGDCSDVYTDDDGQQVYDCPSVDVVYNTSGKLVSSTIDYSVRPAN